MRSLAVFGLVAAVVAAVVAVVGVAAGEGGDGAGAGVGRSGPAGVTGVIATLEQTTAFQARGLLEVAVSNRSPHALGITGLRLVDRRFATVAPTPRDAEIPSGPRRVVMPIDYGEPICESGSGVAAHVEMVERGTGRSVLVPVDGAGEEFLARLHDRECGQRRIRDTVDVAFVGPFDDMGRATVRLSLRVDRRPGSEEPVAVAGMRGTVVFTVTVPADSPLLTLAADEGTATVPIEVSASRCDAHALIESKKSYRFPMWIGVGGTEPRYIEIEPTGDARRVLEQVLQEGCFG